MECSSYRRILHAWPVIVGRTSGSPRISEAETRFQRPRVRVACPADTPQDVRMSIPRAPAAIARAARAASGGVHGCSATLSGHPKRHRPACEEHTRRATADGRMRPRRREPHGQRGPSSPTPLANGGAAWRPANQLIRPRDASAAQSQDPKKIHAALESAARREERESGGKGLASVRSVEWHHQRFRAG